jgi:hypothetical protein
VMLKRAAVLGQNDQVISCGDRLIRMRLVPQLPVSRHADQVIRIRFLRGLEVDQPEAVVDQGDCVEGPAVLIRLRDQRNFLGDGAGMALIAPSAELAEPSHS